MNLIGSKSKRVGVSGIRQNILPVIPEVMENVPLLHFFVLRIDDAKFQHAPCSCTGRWSAAQRSIYVFISSQNN